MERGLPLLLKNADLTTDTEGNIYADMNDVINTSYHLNDVDGDDENNLMLRRFQYIRL